MEDFLRATQSAVLDHEAKTLAAKMGVPHVSLLQRANPDNDAHHLTIEHLFGILLHTGDMRPLEALADSFGFELAAKEPAKARDLSAAMLHVTKEFADVARSVSDAMDDGRVSQHERAQIAREINEARHSLDVMAASVKVA
ncbi:Rha family transcriptional regulator [Stutzerimonas degradans]|nr:Rha family transcriptional regulator [Stutzerimonas degradans]